MLRQIIGKLFYLVIPLLVIGISLGYTTFLVSLLALTVLFMMSNRYTIGFFLIMYGGPIGGITRTLYPFLPVYGVLLEMIGFILMWNLFRDFLTKHTRALLVLIGTLLIFGFFYLIGPQDSYSMNKYSTMWLNALIMLFGYYVFDNSDKIDAENLVMIMLIATICMFTFVITYYHLSPGTIWDYDWFREQTIATYHAQGNEHLYIGYQHIGMMGFYGASIFLSQTRFKPLNMAFFVLVASQLVLMSGCRQAIFGLFIVGALRFLLFREDNIGKKNILGKFLWFVIGGVIVFTVVDFLLSNISSNAIVSTLKEGDESRELLWHQAWNIFLDNRVFGSGLGGFHEITGEVWPHNFILELLCECGFVGTLIFLGVIVSDMSRKHVGLLHVTEANMFFFLVLSALFVRVLVSADLTESVELFSAIFAISSENTKDQRYYFK